MSNAGLSPVAFDLLREDAEQRSRRKDPAPHAEPAADFALAAPLEAGQHQQAADESDADQHVARVRDFPVRKRTAGGGGKQSHCTGKGRPRTNPPDCGKGHAGSDQSHANQRIKRKRLEVGMQRPRQPRLDQTTQADADGR